MTMETEETRVQMVCALSMGCRARTERGEREVIFGNGHVSNDAASGFRMSDRSPSLTMTTAQACELGLERGVAVTVIDMVGDEAQYRVREPQPDGTGMSEIILDAAS